MPSFNEVLDIQLGKIPADEAIDDIPNRFEGQTIEECLEEFKDFVSYNLDDNAVMLNACEETGRIDINVLENNAGYPAGHTEQRLWKKGELKLYNAIYTGYMVMRVDANVDFKTTELGERYEVS